MVAHTLSIYIAVSNLSKVRNSKNIVLVVFMRRHYKSMLLQICLRSKLSNRVNGSMAIYVSNLYHRYVIEAFLHKHDMSHVMTKPAFAYANIKGADQTAHPHLCCSLPR